MNLLQIFVYIFVTSFGRRNVGQSKIRMASDKVYDLLLFSGKQESVDVPTKISFVRQNKKRIHENNKFWLASFYIAKCYQTTLYMAFDSNWFND